jgi:SAM-dependent methyltransferase
MANKYFWRIINSIKKRGLINTILFVLDDFVFKYKYRLDTGGIIELSELTFSGNPKLGTPYQGVNSKLFHNALANLDLDYKNSVFVDIGCGKGKSLILAAEYNFKKIIGVEFAKELVSICKKNVGKIHSKIKTKEFKILYEDGSKYEFAPDINVIFFNNPFNCSELTDKMLNNIELSLKKNPRDLFILYFTPIYSECFTNRDFEKVFEIKAKNKTELMVFKTGYSTIKPCSP